MGGEGFMLQAIKSLKNNRALMKGRKEFNHSLFHEKSKAPLIYKKMNSKELERFKHLIKIRHQKEIRIKIISGIFLISLSIWGLYFLIIS